MFGKSKRQIKNVTFVQPLEGEAYFYTPIGYSINLQSSKEEKGIQVFEDSNLALAGKLKLIFEREKMTWFEIREEKSPTPAKDEHFFALYYYPHRLVANRTASLHEKATLQDIKKLFDFIVTEDQTRFAEVQQIQSPSAYGSVAGELQEELESIPIVAKDQIKDNILQTVKKEKPGTAKQLIVIMQQRYSIPPEQTSNLLIELENEGRLNFTKDESAKDALSQHKIGTVRQTQRALNPQMGFTLKVDTFPQYIEACSFLHRKKSKTFQLESDDQGQQIEKLIEESIEKLLSPKAVATTTPVHSETICYMGVLEKL